MLEYRISLQADDALDSIDDHLKIKENPALMSEGIFLCLILILVFYRYISSTTQVSANGYYLFVYPNKQSLNYSTNNLISRTGNFAYHG